MVLCVFQGIGSFNLKCQTRWREVVRNLPLTSVASVVVPPELPDAELPDADGVGLLTPADWSIVLISVKNPVGLLYFSVFFSDLMNVHIDLTISFLLLIVGFMCSSSSLR